MSPTTSASGAPRRTASAWWTMTSIVAGMVVAWPRAVVESESPTSTSGTPARCAMRAVRKS